MKSIPDDPIVHLVNEDLRALCEDEAYDLGVGVFLWDFVESERCPKCLELATDDVIAALSAFANQRAAEQGFVSSSIFEGVPDDA